MIHGRSCGVWQRVVARGPERGGMDHAEGSCEQSPVNTQCGTGVRGQWHGRKGDTESSSTGTYSNIFEFLNRFLFKHKQYKGMKCDIKILLKV